MRNKFWIVTLAAMLITTHVQGQEKHGIDTLQCHIVGFSAGAIMPLSGSNSGNSANANMKDLYSGPYLNFNIDWAYKWKSNWMATLDADLWFGYNSDNLTLRAERMGDIYTPQGYLMSWGGYDGVVTLYNRGFAVRPGVAKIIPLFRKNPDSGILFKLSGGWFMQKTINTQDMNESQVPQLNERMMKLYDHLRNGVIITESVGFIFMSNRSTYVNFKVTFDISQCISWSSRPHIIDNVMGLNGKDKNTYFDLLAGMKLSWMFPFTGKTAYDYYYY